MKKQKDPANAIADKKQKETAKRSKSNAMMFYYSYYMYIEKIVPKKQRRQAYEMLMKYAFEGVVPEISKTPKSIYGLYLLAKELIDANRRNHSRSVARSETKQRKNDPKKDDLLSEIEADLALIEPQENA